MYNYCIYSVVLAVDMVLGLRGRQWDGTVAYIIVCRLFLFCFIGMVWVEVSQFEGHRFLCGQSIYPFRGRMWNGGDWGWWRKFGTSYNDSERWNMRIAILR